MDRTTHHGQLIEYAVRNKGINLTDLAVELNVNRRTIYNWFESSFLKKNIIHRVGLTINHDFSNEFPHLFTADTFSSDNVRHSNIASSNNDSSEWKDKYIDLLEKYNQVLTVMNNRI